MTRPVFLITLGALAGAVVGMINGGGELGGKIADSMVDAGWSAERMLESPRSEPVRSGGGPEVSHFVFSSCLRKSGAKVDQTLLELVEFHEHGATLALVDCLLGGEPARFCTPAGRQQAADAMKDPQFLRGLSPEEQSMLRDVYSLRNPPLL